MSGLTKEQIKEVTEVIKKYSIRAKSLDELQKEERQREKLIAFLKSEERNDETNNNKSLW